MPRGKKKVEDAVVASTPVVEEAVPSTVEKVKTAVANVTVMNPETKEQVLTLVKGLGVSAADAMLVHLSDNISTVNMGTYKPIVVSLVNIGVRELRNLLHGGQVSDEVFVEALQTILPEVKEDLTAAKEEVEEEVEGDGEEEETEEGEAK